MGKRRLPVLSRVEWDLMNEIWRRGQATVADVQRHFLSERGWEHNTVKTMMQRLVRKGYLRCDRSERSHLYRPAVDRDQTASHALTETLDKILEHGFGPLVAYAAERKKLSREEIKALKDLLEGDAAP